MLCAYCERPLICESCNAEFVFADEARYEAFNSAEEPVFCPECEDVLVCHWCKARYEGPQGRDSQGQMREG